MCILLPPTPAEEWHLENGDSGFCPSGPAFFVVATQSQALPEVGGEGSPPGFGVRQPSGALEMGVKWTVARIH